MRFLVLFCALMAWSAKADAQMMDPRFRFSEVAGVMVELNDQATRACWTNLKEVREYAEEKIRIKGAKVLNIEWANKKDYLLSIRVLADRFNKDGSSFCVGLININLHTYSFVNDFAHEASIASRRFTVQHPNNFNRYTIEAVSDLISELK